jgi:hypothetical protein
MAKKTQIDKFKEAARASGADQDEKAFNRAVKKVANSGATVKRKKRAKK